MNVNGSISMLATAKWMLAFYTLILDSYIA